MKYAAFLLGICLSSSALAFDVLQPLPETPIIPTNNPQNEEKVALGKQLFFDNRLAGNHDVSCNGCHNLSRGGDDDGGVTRMPNRDIRRSAPSVYNAAHQSTYFWDARALSLEDMAIDHLFDPNIMGNQDRKKLVSRIKNIPGYHLSFKKTFEDGVTLENISKVIAAFIRSLNTPNSAFDKYITGDKTALSPSAKRGLEIFRDTGCMSCHFGVNFAGPAPGPAYGMGDGFYELFPNNPGTSYDELYGITEDVGRVLITRDRSDVYMWRVAPLRNIAMTAPYFHNGSVNSLDEAVRVMAKTQLKLNLPAKDVKDVVAFLESLTGEYPEMTLPRLPETPGKSLVK